MLPVAPTIRTVCILICSGVSFLGYDGALALFNASVRACFSVLNTERRTNTYIPAGVNGMRPKVR